MKSTVITGVALIALGIAVLGYGHYSYTTTEEVLKIGSLTATAEETHTIALPKVLGWLLLGGGAAVLVYAALSNRR